MQREMKDDHPVQTPQKDNLHANRRLKSTPERNLKHQKSHRKSLNSVFLPVFEDVVSESPKDSLEISSSPKISEESPKDFLEISSFSKISEDYQLTESPESITTSLSPVISSSSETPLSSVITLFSSANSAKTAEPCDHSVNRCGLHQLDAKDSDSFEVELLEKHLRQAMVPILNSDAMDSRYKKLLDAMGKIVIEEFYRMPQERDWLTELSSRKYQVIFLSFMLWLLAVMFLFFTSTGARPSFSGPPPT